MIARMLATFGWYPRRPAAPAAITRPRTRPARLGTRMRIEALEKREVLSTATETLAPFVTLPGSITTGGQAAQVALHFNAGQVASTSGASSVLVGFYAEAASGSTLQITEVDGPNGALTKVNLPRRGGITPPKALFVTYLPTSLAAAEDITVKVTEPGKQTGDFVVKAFLPGDADASGTVDATDLALVQSAYGTALGQPNNNPAADFNVDGHVGHVDLRLTEMNQGAHVTFGTPPAVAAAVAPTPAPALIAAPTVIVRPTLIEAPVVVTIPTAIATPTVAPAPVPVVQYNPVLTYSYPQAATTAPSPYYYYGQPAVQPTGYAPATVTGAYGQPAAAPMPVYYTPTAQASNYVTSTPVYYSPTAQAQASNYATSTPVYYTPTAQAQASNYAAPMPVYYTPTPPGQVRAGAFT